MTWIIGLIVLLVATSILVIWLSKPKIFKKRKFEDFSEFIDGLLTCEIGSFLVFKHSESSKFLQLALQYNNEVKVIHFGFPYAEWSKNYFELLAQVLSEKKITFKITETDTEEVPKFLDIDIAIDESDSYKEAVLKILEIGFEVLEININDDHFNIQFEGEAKLKAGKAAYEALKYDSNTQISRWANRKLKKIENEQN